MNYQYALVRMMEERNLSIFDVAANTDWSVRYAEAVARTHPVLGAVACGFDAPLPSSEVWHDTAGVESIDFLLHRQHQHAGGGAG